MRKGCNSSKAIRMVLKHVLQQRVDYKCMVNFLNAYMNAMHEHSGRHPAMNCVESSVTLTLWTNGAVCDWILIKLQMIYNKDMPINSFTNKFVFSQFYDSSVQANFFLKSNKKVCRK